MFKWNNIRIIVSLLIYNNNRNLKNILVYLKKQHHITICKKTLQNFLKDTGLLYREKIPGTITGSQRKVYKRGKFNEP